MIKLYEKKTQMSSRKIKSMRRWRWCCCCCCSRQSRCWWWCLFSTECLGSLVDKSYSSCANLLIKIFKNIFLSPKRCYYLSIRTSLRRYYLMESEIIWKWKNNLHKNENLSWTLLSLKTFMLVTLSSVLMCCKTAQGINTLIALKLKHCRLYLLDCFHLNFRAVQNVERNLNFKATTASNENTSTLIEFNVCLNFTNLCSWIVNVFHSRSYSRCHFGGQFESQFSLG